jgi:cell shape-determining protein MreC
MPDGLRFRMLASKYKVKRWNLFGLMIDFFEKYYEVLESKFFRMQTFLDEKTQLEVENKALKEENSNLKKELKKAAGLVD